MSVGADELGFWWRLPSGGDERIRNHESSEAVRRAPLEEEDTHSSRTDKDILAPRAHSLYFVKYYEC
jgi:hypothetical protein